LPISGNWQRIVVGLIKSIDDPKPARAQRDFLCAKSCRNFPASLKEQKITMTNDNKSECVDSIVRMLERTSAWRRAISPNFNDPRIARAADTLDKLAVDATAMTDDQFLMVKDRFVWDSILWRNSLSQAARQIGFHNRSSDFRSFVRALVHELSLSSRVAA
jgi:hypothetical protein